MSLNPRDRPVVSDDNLSAVVQILAICFLSFSIISVTVEATTKRAISKRFSVPDYVLFVALILVIAATATLLSPAGRAIGNSIGNVSTKAAEDAFKAIYAGTLLDVLALGMIKIAMLFAFYAITPVKMHRFMIYGVGGLVTAWVISGLFIISLQCDAPHRWMLSEDKCINLVAARIYIAVLNIVTDAMLMIIPTIIIASVKLPLSKRITLLASFWVRLIVIGTTIVQIVFLKQLNYADGNLLRDIWKVVVCREAVQCSSIITACIPFLKPFMGSLQSGFLLADDAKLRNASQMGGSHLAGSHSQWSSRYVEIQKQPTTSSIRLQTLTPQSGNSGLQSPTVPGTPRSIV